MTEFHLEGGHRRDTRDFSTELKRQAERLEIVSKSEASVAVCFVLQLWNVLVSKLETRICPFQLRVIVHADSLLTGIIAWLAGGWPRSEGEPWGRSRGSMALSIRVSSLRRRLRQLSLQRVSSPEYTHREFPIEGSGTGDKSNARCKFQTTAHRFRQLTEWINVYGRFGKKYRVFKLTKPLGERGKLRAEASESTVYFTR